MASSSPRCVGPTRGPLRLTPPRSCSPDTGASNETTYNSCSAPDPLLSRIEAVDRDAARRKFAFYGRQHAHVDHLSGSDQDITIILQSTILLQEDGLLAARLDDVTYLLDGLLEPVTTQRGRLAQARSVLDLIQLLQDPKILQVVELSSQRRSIQSKVKQLLLSKLGEAQEETFRVSLAVLVYFLSSHSGAEDYFDQKVLDKVVYALKQEVQKREKTEDERKSTAVSEVATQQVVPLKKTCLKRKRQANGQGKIGAEAGKTVASSSLAMSTTQLLDELCRMRLDELLRDHEEVYVEGELQISVVGTLCAALHNLLQVDGSSSSSSGLTQRHQQQRSARSGNTAGDTFKLIRARKRQLVQNGGVDILAYHLDKQLTGLEALLPSTQAEEVTIECARSLHYIGMLLCVFDQVTFLTVDVQQYIAKQRNVVALLLKFAILLSELSWGTQALKRWNAQSTRMSLAMEVLLATLRVLLNLTHHNAEAASHVHTLGGMQLLAAAFSQLWTFATTSVIAVKQLPAQDKWEFDSSLLLLSVMINSIEFSDENRDALTTASLCQVNSRRDDAGMSAQTILSACDLFTSFFLAKLQSYKHLIDLTEAQGASGAISIEDEGDNWSPEDVILGGCTSLLLGYLMKSSAANSAAILESMPDGSPRLLLRALGVFVAFHSQIGALTPEVAKSVLHVEKVLKSCQESGFDTDESELLDEVFAKASSGDCEWQHPTPISAAKSEDADIDPSTTMSLSIENSVVSQRSDVSPPAVRARPLKNVCSNLDESVEDNESHVQIQKKVARLKMQNSQAFGMRTPTRTPPRSPGRKRPRAESPMKTPPVSLTSGKSSFRASNSSPIAVLPDGSLSSPVGARLLKRTRQLVEEFDAEFAKSTHSCSMKKSGDSIERGTTKIDRSPSPCMVFTMDVTCRDNGSDGLDLSQDMGEENSTNIGTTEAAMDQEGRTTMALKRKQKPNRDPGTSAKSAIVYQETFPSNTPPSTPLRTKKSKLLPQTPTRTGPSPGLYRQSPSPNLTPTKSSPSTPLRMKKSSGLLRTPTRNDLSSAMKESPISASPHRRKAKVVRAPAATLTSSVFDFTD